LDKPIKIKTLKQLVTAWVRYRKTGGEYVTLSDDISRYWREQLGDLYEQFYTDVELGADVGLGWIKLYVDACKKMKVILDANPDLKLKVGQVKQKLGGLRMYVYLDPIDHPAKEAINAVVSCAYDEADRTCETCGDPGAACASGRIRISCAKHSRV